MGFRIFVSNQMPLSSAVSLALLGVTGLHALNAPVPFLPRPYYLTGELAADAGFDPAGLVLSPLLSNPAALADPTKVRRSLMWMREAEIKHARLAMLAAAGWPLAEMWHGGLSNALSLPYLLDATLGRAPSILNGGLGSSAGFLALAVLVATVVELNLHNFYGCQMPPMVEMRARTDENYRLEWIRFNQKQMQAAELRNGRLAMLAITGFAIQECVYKIPVVDQTPIFFTPITTLLFGQPNLMG